MKIIFILGILMLAGAIVYIEWKRSQDKKVRRLTAGATAVSAVLGIILLFEPHLPGPSDIVKLLFGSVDKLMK